MGRRAAGGPRPRRSRRRSAWSRPGPRSTFRAWSWRQSDLDQLLEADPAVWEEEAALIAAAYEVYGDRLPQALWDQHAELVTRLKRAGSDLASPESLVAARPDPALFQVEPLGLGGRAAAETAREGAPLAGI